MRNVLIFKTERGFLCEKQTFYIYNEMQHHSSSNINLESSDTIVTRNIVLYILLNSLTAEFHICKESLQPSQ